MNFNEIKGQEHIKRGLEVAAAGIHSVLLIGPPDAGKRALAEAFMTITDRQVIIVNPFTYLEEHFSLNNIPRGSLIVAIMQPCACGNFTSIKEECTCTPIDITNHLSKLPKELLDRVAIHLEVPKLDMDRIGRNRAGESSATIKDRVVKADTFLSDHESEMECDKEANELLKLAILELGISSAAYEKILLVAKTVAALDCREIVEAHHISEAISYRSLDRNLWG